VAEKEGGAFPSECDCPADGSSDEYDCKHGVAHVAVGGQTVLQAAVDYAIAPEQVAEDVVAGMSLTPMDSPSLNATNGR